MATSRPLFEKVSLKAREIASKYGELIMNVKQDANVKQHVQQFLKEAQGKLAELKDDVWKSEAVSQLKQTVEKKLRMSESRTHTVSQSPASQFGSSQPKAGQPEQKSDSHGKTPRSSGG